MTVLGLADKALIAEAAFVDGAWLFGTGTVPVDDPATGAIIGHVPVLGPAEVEAAIACADRARPDWSGRTAKERSDLLRRWYELVVEHQQDLALILTAEQGKPLEEARKEILYGASYIEWFAEEARRLYGELLPGHAREMRLLIMRQPIGVVAAITPWNFPNAMVTRKAAPALAAGCTMVLKPALETPFSALALAELARRAGIPDGVFNVVTGHAQDIGPVLTQSPIVTKLSFTGSTEVGRLLMAQCAPTVKKVSLELGGNAPFIVFDDADIEAAIEGALVAKFRNNGQTCVCANRFFVQSGVYAAFVEKFAAAVSALRVGNGLDGVDLGPLISETARAKVIAHIADATARGATLVTGGKVHKAGPNFFEPTVLASASTDMLVAREETFGPVAAVIRFDSEVEVLDAANNSDFGLAGYFYARDIGRIWRVAEALECGMVGVNTGLISTATAPFGGIKQSGIGREGSRHGIDEYTELKYVCLSLPGNQNLDNAHFDVLYDKHTIGRKT